MRINFPTNYDHQYEAQLAVQVSYDTVMVKAARKVLIELSDIQVSVGKTIPDDFGIIGDLRMSQDFP